MFIDRHDKGSVFSIISNLQDKSLGIDLRKNSQHTVVKMLNHGAKHNKGTQPLSVKHLYRLSYLGM